MSTYKTLPLFERETYSPKESAEAKVGEDSSASETKRKKVRQPSYNDYIYHFYSGILFLLLVGFRIFQSFGWTLGIAALTAQVVTAFSFGVPIPLIVPVCLFVGLCTFIINVYKHRKRMRELYDLTSKIAVLDDESEEVDTNNNAFLECIQRKQRQSKFNIPAECESQIQGLSVKIATIKQRKGKKPQESFFMQVIYSGWLLFKCGYSFLAGFGLSLTVLAFFVPLVMASSAGLSIHAVYQISAAMGLLNIITEYLIMEPYEDAKDDLFYELEGTYALLRERRKLNCALRFVYELQNTHPIQDQKVGQQHNALTMGPKLPSPKVGYKRFPTFGLGVFTPRTIDEIDSQQIVRYSRNKIQYVLKSCLLVIFRVIEGVGWTLFLGSLAAHTISSLSHGVPIALIMPVCLIAGSFSLIQGIYKQIDRNMELRAIEEKINFLATLSYRVNAYNQELGDSLMSYLPTLQAEPHLDTIALLENFTSKADVDKETLSTTIKALNSKSTLGVIWENITKVAKFFHSFLSGFGLSLTILTYFVPMVIGTSTGLPFGAIYLVSTLVGLLQGVVDYLIMKAFEKSRNQEFREVEELFTETTISCEVNAGLAATYTYLNHNKALDHANEKVRQHRRQGALSRVFSSQFIGKLMRHDRDSADSLEDDSGDAHREDSASSRRDSGETRRLVPSFSVSSLPARRHASKTLDQQPLHSRTEDTSRRCCFL